MKSSKYFVLATLLVALVQADQNQTDFLSIDCGSSNSSYVDETTGFVYLSDRKFVETGENKEIADAYKVQVNERQFLNVRSFPQGTRNCYTMKLAQGKGTKYLVRARFMYGNYDNRGQAPTFDLYLGVDFWDTVITQFAWVKVDREILFFPSLDYVDVCLVNTGYGTPFISVLELRPWDNNSYNLSGTGSGLQLHGRYNFNPANNQEMRYKDDVYDRLWSPFIQATWIPLNASDSDNITQNNYKLPFTVIGTAYSPNASIGNLKLTVLNINTTFEYYFFFHFAELLALPKKQSREFNIYLNGNFSYGPLVPKYLVATTVLITKSGITRDNEGSIRIWLNRTQHSTLPPLLNALEIYVLKELSQQGTNQIDVDAILNIKSVYGVQRIWQGDPCAPKAYVWDGVGCSYDANNNPLRITSLNLSSSGLKGEISPYIANLTMIQYLDLSNNNLTGTVPEFLAQLSFLRVLNLKGNNLKGPVPDALLERSKSGSLSLSVDSNVIGNQTSSSKRNEASSAPGYYSCILNKFVVPLFVSVSGILLNFVL